MKKIEKIDLCTSSFINISISSYPLSAIHIQLKKKRTKFISGSGSLVRTVKMTVEIAEKAEKAEKAVTAATDTTAATDAPNTLDTPAAPAEPSTTASHSP